MTPIKIKLLSLSIALIITALFFSYTLSVFNQSLGLGALILLLISVILFLALFIVQVMVIKNLFLMSALCLSESVVMLIPFIKNTSFFLIGAVAVVSAILIASAISGRQELKNTLKINFIKTGGRIIHKASIALILFGVVAYTSSIAFQDIVNLLFKSSEPLIQSLAGAVLPEAAPVIQAQVQDLLLVQLTGLSDNVKKLVLVGFGLLLFFSIRGMFFLISWVSSIVSYAIYKILLATRFITITTETKEKEVVTL